MKSSVGLALVIFWFDVLFASPLINHRANDATPHRKPGHETMIKDLKHRFVLIPDTDGRMHLIDMELYVPEIGPLFDAQKDMKFILSTRQEQGREIKMDVESIEASTFDSRHPTRFTFHGWNGDETSGVNALVTEAYLKHGDYNVIMVDWSLGAGTIDYIKARWRINEAANFTANFIDFLHHRGYVQHKNLHIIGHSLGANRLLLNPHSAHAAGLVGKYVSTGRVQAIFGLDSAGPLFYYDEPDERLTHTDAEYVEVLHTNGFNLGLGGPIGHADFFPNFGRWQPGCGWWEVTGTCSHLRASELFAESINCSGFVAKRCASAEEIGKDRCTDQLLDERIVYQPEPTNFGLTGHFFFETYGESPFARG